MTAVVLTALGVLLASSAAQAQGAASVTPGWLLSVEVGAQPTQRDVALSTSFSLYDETATISTTQAIQNGPIFGGSVGREFTDRLAFVVGVTSFTARSSEASIVGRIPDPAVYDQPRTVTTTVGGLAHSQLGFNLQAVWRIPVSETLEVSLAAGPSLVRARQDVAGAAVRTGGQQLSTSVSSESGTGFGVNAGADAHYRLSASYSAGVFVRYVAAQVNLPSISDLKVGGVQAGLGLRVRF